MNDWNDKLECVNKSLTVAFKVGVLVGGVVIGVYSWLIGYFPSGVTISDGLLFILLATVLSAMLALFSFSFMSLGVALWPLWRFVIYILDKCFALINKITNKNLTTDQFSTIRRARAEHYCFALFGLIFAGYLFLQDWRSVMAIVVLLFISSVMWSTLQENEEEATNQLASDTPEEQKEVMKKSVRKKNSILLIAIVLMPLGIPGVPSLLVTGVMRATDVRVESASVHIKEPYRAYALESGIVGAKSNFGVNFSKFEEAKVLFKGIGTNTLISFKVEKDKLVQFVVPNTSIHVLPN